MSPMQSVSGNSGQEPRKGRKASNHKTIGKARAFCGECLDFRMAQMRGTSLFDWISKTMKAKKPREECHWNACSIGRSSRPFRGLVYDKG